MSLVCIAIAFWCASGEVHALPAQESFEREHSQAASKNPQGVAFVLRLKDGRVSFHQGEVIPIELAFSSSVPDRFVANGTTRDRSGRLDVDSFHIAPADGVVDPLHDYFDNPPVVGRIGGGPQESSVLGGTPYGVLLDLNEWLRFDKPGRYRLFVTTTRLTDGLALTDKAEPRKPLVVASNVVEFEVLPREAEWSETTLRKARESLATFGGRGEQPQTMRYLKEWRAARVVRFLDTETAVKEMVQRLPDTDDWPRFQYYIGLLGSSHPEAVMRETARAWEEPDYVVTRDLITVRSLLRFFELNPRPMPPYPAGDRAAIKSWLTKYGERQQAYAKIFNGEFERLAADAAKKRFPVRLQCLYTLLERLWWQPYHGCPLPSFTEREREWVAELIEQFDELPFRLQDGLLGGRWSRVRGPDTLPLLRRLWNRPTEEQTRRGLRSTALRLLYELAPAEARQIIRKAIKDIGDSPPSRELAFIDEKLLGVLPEETLPELDDTLAAKLEATSHGPDDMDRQCYLVARYASSSILPRVKAVYSDRGGKWACVIQDDLLAYFLRVRPDFGAEKVREALSKRGEGYSHCYPSLISSLAKWRMTRELKEIAVECLQDPDAEVGADAAKALGEHGPPDVEQSLWRRLEQWHDEWKDRKNDLQAWYPHGNPDDAQVQLEEALLRAITQSPAWLADKERLIRLHQLCVTDEARRQVEEYLKTKDVPVSYFGNDYWRVGQYELTSFEALQKKLAQYPKGTVLRWRYPAPTGIATEDPRLKQFEAFVRSTGLRLVSEQK